MLFLIANTLSFAEIPHSYVTENPKKEVQKVETFKQRDKAELNLSVTKVKTKKIFAQANKNNGYYEINTDNLKNKNIIVTENVPLIPNKNNLKVKKSLKILETDLIDGKLNIVNDNIYSKNKVFINSFNDKNELDGIYEIMPLSAGYCQGHKSYGTAYLNIEISDKYDGDMIRRIGGNVNNPIYGTGSGRGIKILGYTRFNNNSPALPYRGGGFELNPGVMFCAIGTADCNGVRYYTAPRKGHHGDRYDVDDYPYTLGSQNNYPSGRVNKDGIDVAMGSISGRDEYGIRLYNYPKKDFTVTIYIYGE